MKPFSVIFFLVMPLIFVVTSANAKVYICGSTGTLLYSDRPCEIPKTDWSIMPVKASILEKANIDKTVELYRGATKKIDVNAIKRLLTDDFKFVSRDKSWKGRVIFHSDRKGFVALLAEQLLAMTLYEQKIESYAVLTLDDELVAETTSLEKIEMGDRKINAKILERIYFVLQDDEVKIKAIKQLEL